MADPATQFQPATLQASGYTPVVGGNLGGSHLFGGAGALWAQVGKTALEAGEAIQKSALNPAVRESMKYSIDQYKRAEELIAKQRQMGGWGYLLGTTGPGGYSQIAPGQITDPTLAQQYLNKLIGGYPSVGGGDGGKGPDINPDTGDQGYSESAAVSGPRPGDQKPEKKTPPTAKQMGTAQATPGTFLNPATTNMFASNAAANPPSVDQYAISQVPSQVRAQTAGGGVNPALFAGGDTSQMVNQQQQQPQDQDQTPLGKQLMSQWQNQNAHPVAPVSEALKWAKNNFDTRVQDATYLPHGGPLNQPAYAFHMKSGGTNLVPLSQMVRNGFAANVAGNQTSITLSQAEAMQPQLPGGNQPTGAVGGQAPALQQGQGTQPPPQLPGGNQPTGNVGQPQPPAAPGAAPGAIAGGVAGVPAAPGSQEQLTDIYGNPLSTYTGLPSKGGPGPEQLTAETGQAPGTRIDTTQQPDIPNVSKADQAAIQALADKTSKDAARDRISGDRRVEGTPAGGPTYYIDDNPDSVYRGRAYQVMPGQKGSYYDQDRWYLGKNNWGTYSLDTSVMRQHMEDYWTDAGQLTPAEIKKMGPEDMKPWLERAWQNKNFTRNPPETGTNLSLDTLEDIHKTNAQIKDILTALAKHGYPNLNSMDRVEAGIQNAFKAVGLGQTPWGSTVGSFEDPRAAEAVRTLDAKIDHIHTLLQEHPELLVSPGTSEGVNFPGLPIGGLTRLGPVGVDLKLPPIPKSDVLSNAAFGGQDLGTKLRDLDSYQEAVDTRYRNLVSGAQTQWWKIDDRHAANLIRLSQNKELPDKTNVYSSHDLPPPTVSEAKPTAQPSPTPMVHVNSPSELEAFKKKYPSGTHFMGPDGKGGVREWVTP